MAGIENLEPVRTKEEARERGRNGGIASGKARKQRKAMKEQMEMLLSLPLKDSAIKGKFKKLGIDTGDMNNQMALMVAMYQKALKGDTSAMNIIREVIGERVQQVSIETNVDDKVKELQTLLNDEE